MKMISVQRAQRIVLKHAKLQSARKIVLRDALGFVLARDISAATELPSFTNSAMDGYAVRSLDIRKASPAFPIALQIAEYLPAGKVSAKKVASGACAQIMTGAPLPGGADAVIPVEETERRGEYVKIHSPVPRGANIRYRGEDVKKGKVLRKGSVVRPQEIALLAALGCSHISVFSRPTAAVLSTGDELISHSAKLSIGKVRDSNSLTLDSLLRTESIFPKRLGIAKDSRKDLRRKIREGLQSDLLLISGGVSVGTHDLVRSVLEELGVREIFWKIRMKPGKPVFMGKRGKTLIFGLPGNPTSGFVAFEIFVRPAIRRMAGFSDALPIYHPAIAAHELKHRNNKVDYFRGVASRNKGCYSVRSAGRQGSHCLKSLSRANVLIRLPENVSVVAPGDGVEVLMLCGRSL